MRVRASAQRRRGRLADGTHAVLKVQRPAPRERARGGRRSSSGTATARSGCSPTTTSEHALLLERCVPGDAAAAAGADAALDVFVELLPRLWKPAGAPFRPLAEEAAWWADVPARGTGSASAAVRARLLDAALEALQELPPTAGRAGARPPGPARRERPRRRARAAGSRSTRSRSAGEREFGVAPIVRSRELGPLEAGRPPPLRPADGGARSRPRARARLDDRADGRVGGDGDYTETHVETARWLLEAAG